MKIVRSLRWLACVFGFVYWLGGCGGVSDDECQGPDVTWYRDQDADSYGDPAMTLSQCAQPAGYVDNNQDCDDSNELVNPATNWHPDGDGDGYGDTSMPTNQCVKPSPDHVVDGTDCNDGDATVNPETVWYQDDDGDTYGNAAVMMTACAQPADYVADNTDCDDTDDEINPDSIWYVDGDGDGFGNPVMQTAQCAQPSVDHVLIGTDCNDNDPVINPGTLWYFDDDGDGAGDATMSMVQCTQPLEHVLDNRDCNDGNDAIKPGTGDCPFTPADATSCKDILADSNSEGDGAYAIDPDGSGAGAAFTVWCDMTIDGGGWTALLNPSNKAMPGPTYPGLTFAGSQVGGGSDTCSGSSALIEANGSHGIGFVRCGNLTIRTTITWSNVLGATDVMFIATLQGQNTATVTTNGNVLAPDAIATDGNGATCTFHNGTATSVTPTPGFCWQTYLDQPPKVHNAAFSTNLSMEVTTGPGCAPTCTYGEGHNIQRLYVR